MLKTTNGLTQSRSKGFKFLIHQRRLRYNILRYLYSGVNKNLCGNSSGQQKSLVSIFFPFGNRMEIQKSRCCFKIETCESNGQPEVREI